MTKTQKDTKFGDVVASSLTLEKANTIRSKIKTETVGLWVFVYKGKNNKYEVGVQTNANGTLPKDELAHIKAIIKDVKGKSTQSESSKN